MKKLIVGILAHVDAGKTTLSEGLLYHCGCLRALGRVDHGDAFLDTFALERERGITIFSKQAVLPLPEVELTLMDTPGHVDFSAEMERTLQILDCAVLVLSGTDGVQAHTRTLWRLLEQYHIPTFFFLNKMDLAGADRSARMAELQSLSEHCVDFDGPPEALWESVALCGEEALEQYLEHGTVPPDTVARLVAKRRLFPCYFGSALRLDGIDSLLSGLAAYGSAPVYPAEFGARVYKIARDAQGNRLTYLKVTGGSLRVKDILRGRLREDTEQSWEEKADQLRVYSGAKYKTVEEIPAGGVCAVCGLSRTYPGQGLGMDAGCPSPLLEPVLTYQLLLPAGCDPHTALLRLRELEEEDPQLHLVWDEQLRQIHIQLMGEVQREILQRLIPERFGFPVSFGPGSIVYRETIAAPVLGAGHFEPLRHYAEVHLLLRPLPRGSGLVFDSVCPEDMLEKSWQRLILTHLAERPHRGALTGSPITDLRITLTAGRAHVKHTEGGDFRQATYRAVRQGLLSAQGVLLEPWYTFRLELPAGCVGRAMTDLQQMGGEVSPPETVGGESVLTGSAPVAGLRDYAAAVRTYTQGQGRLSCTLQGYAPCPDQAAVVAALGYDPERDVAHPADSVFCVHGAGETVHWRQAAERMHVDSGVRLDGGAKPSPETATSTRRSAAYAGTLAQDKELQAIFERTYGAVKRRDFLPPKPPQVLSPEKRDILSRDTGPEYLLVDGYNLIFAWEELKAVARDNLDAARTRLCDLLCSYQAMKHCVVIVVFDAYKVPGGTGEVSRYHNIHVVYTKEAETADAFIEKATYQIARQHRVRVATSDGPEQLIILGHGALRLSASAFWDELGQAQAQLAALIQRNNRPGKSRAVQTAFEKAETQDS